MRCQPEVQLLHPTETDASEQSDLREFFLLLRRHALLIVFATVLTALVTFAVTFTQAKQYSSSTTLLYAPTPSTAVQDPVRDIATITGIGTSNAVLQPVALQRHLTLAALKSDLSISSDPNANLIKVSATAGTADTAAALANGVASALIAYQSRGRKQLFDAQIVSLQHQLQAFAGRSDPSSVAAASDLRTQLAEARAQLAVASPDLSVLTEASPPSGSSSPHPARDGAIGLFAGLILGVLLGVLRDRLDRRVRGVGEVEALYHAPLLGMVPFLKRHPVRAEMLADFSEAGALADAYRAIRTNLALVRLGSQTTTVIVVTSATSQEGKSAVSANLGCALSVMGKNVLAVSADLHSPSLHEYFATVFAEGDLPFRPPAGDRPRLPRSGRLAQATVPAGLVQVLAGEVSLSDAARVVPFARPAREGGGSLTLLADASTFFDPAVLLGSDAMAAFFTQAKREYDVIVLDTPPLIANSDAALLAQAADVVVVVARLDHLTNNQARRAVRTMAAARVVPTGLVITGELEEPDYGYGYRDRATVVEPETVSTVARASTNF